ncbi:ParB/RepB/Spo0J family partition protein [Streptomyces lasiicapitis]|uniref:ParB/RepB/Spo0J family partition protein n=1 Tax=Streptomyces lasiicapitis TaxID=1923961 RepID=UPI003329BEDD
MTELAVTLVSDGMNTAMTVIPPDIFIAKYPKHEAEVRAAVAKGVRYVVHHGHRRLAAAHEAGLEEVPILVRHDVPSLGIAAMQENLQRMSLSPVEEGEEFQKAIETEWEDEAAEKRYTQRSLAARIGISQTYISQRIALIRLTPVLQEAVANHWLKENGVEVAADALLLPVKPAATIYARLIPEIQDAWASGALLTSAAEVVCKLRSDLQTEFFGCQLTLEDAKEIGKLPPGKQKMPEPPETVKSATPTPPEPSTGATTPPVPTPRGEKDTEASAGDTREDETRETQAGSAPEVTSGLGDVGGTGPQGTSGTSGTTESSDGSDETSATTDASVVTATPRVIEIREQQDLDKLVYTLIDTLTEEERTYVREHLV